jgi:hypothetical protein
VAGHRLHIPHPRRRRQENATAQSEHPGLNATVFRPKDKQGYYLVCIGGRVTYEEALRVQSGARARGLPRDLYVQNYLE